MLSGEIPTYLPFPHLFPTFSPSVLVDHRIPGHQRTGSGTEEGPEAAASEGQVPSMMAVEMDSFAEDNG